MTKANNTSGAQTSRAPRRRSAHELRGAAGSKRGRSVPINAIVAIYIDTASNPGSTPAMNSLPMSCCVIRP